MPTFETRGLRGVAAVGGVTNGLIGAWGPVITPFLMHRGLTPRFAVGSVNTAEVAVATVSATSLVASVGSGGLRLSVLLSMLAGGVAAAPLAAWVVRHIPARPMGLAVAALLLITSARELGGWADLAGSRWALYAAVAVVVGLTAAVPRLRPLAPAPATVAGLAVADEPAPTRLGR